MGARAVRYLETADRNRRCELAVGTDHCTEMFVHQCQRGLEPCSFVEDSTASACTLFKRFAARAIERQHGCGFAGLL